MKKLAALNKENFEEHPISNLAQNSNVPRSHEHFITQVSEEIEGRVTKKLSQEFNRTESRILGALSCVGDFLLQPIFQGDTGIAPEASRNTLSTNQGTHEDDSRSDPHPEAGVSQNQTINSGPDDTYDICASGNLKIWDVTRRLTMQWTLSNYYLNFPLIFVYGAWACPFSFSCNISRYTIVSEEKRFPGILVATSRKHNFSGTRKAPQRIFQYWN